MPTYTERAAMRARKRAATVAPKRAARIAAPQGGSVRNRAQQIDRAVDEMVNGTRIIRRD